MLILKANCKLLGYTVAEFSDLVETPEQTLRNWCKTRVPLMEALFSGVRAQQLLEELQKDLVVKVDSVNRDDLKGLVVTGKIENL